MLLKALTDVESPEINALKNYLTLSFKKDKMAFIEENPFRCVECYGF